MATNSSHALLLKFKMKFIKCHQRLVVEHKFLGFFSLLALNIILFISKWCYVYLHLLCLLSSIMSIYNIFFVVLIALCFISFNSIVVEIKTYAMFFKILLFKITIWNMKKKLYLAVYIMLKSKMINVKMTSKWITKVSFTGFTGWETDDKMETQDHIILIPQGIIFQCKRWKLLQPFLIWTFIFSW